MTEAHVPQSGVGDRQKGHNKDELIIRQGQRERANAG